jgi:hypothetical protein
MALTKERVDNNIEKILFNNKPASLSGVVVVKDCHSKKGWIIVDSSDDTKITKGLTNVANKLNIKFNADNFYCQYNGDNLIENQKYDIVADLYLSKHTTLYGKINKLNLNSTSIDSHLSDSITILNKEEKSSGITFEQEKNISQKRNAPVGKIPSSINLSDETINRIKLVMKESFSEVLRESTKNLSELVEVIKELSVVIDKKGETQFSNKQINEDLPFDDEDFPFNNNEEKKGSNLEVKNEKIDNIGLSDSSDDLPND